MIREMINWPKRQYLRATSATTTAASTATSTTTTITITKTSTSVAGTTKAENIEINIWGNADEERWTKSKHIMCLQNAEMGVSAIFLERIIVSRGNFRGNMSAIFSWPKVKMYPLILLLMLLLLLLLLLIIIHYYCYYCSYCYHYYYDIK